MTALARVVCTCPSVPAQWDAWTVDGQYLYLRYRFGRGTVDAYDSHDPDTWDVVPDGYVAAFRDPDEPLKGEIELDEFLRRSGLRLAPLASVVSYEERQDGRLLLSPKIDEDRAPLEVVLDASPFVRREIIERYLLGYDILRVQSKDSLPPDVREEVRKTTKRLVGLEVLEEDSRRIVLQCLVEPSLLNPERILRRLEMLSMPMQLDAVQSFVSSNGELSKGVVERDEEVDRWYFLLVRLVRAAIADTYLLEKIKVSSVDCLDFRLLASYIENFADYAVTIAENTQADVPIPREEQTLLEKIGLAVNAMYKDAVGSVLSRDLKLASSVGPRFKEAKRQLSDAEAKVAGSSRPLVNHLVAVIIALNRMCEISVDISDLTITR